MSVKHSVVYFPVNSVALDLEEFLVHCSINGIYTEKHMRLVTLLR